MEKNSLDDIQREMMIAIRDLQRRLNNILRPGRIVDVDPGMGRVKVRIGEGDISDGAKPLDTAWLPVLQQRAGETIDWDFPEIGEQVLVLSPGGEPGCGYVGHAIYSAAHAQPSKNSRVKIRKFSDGLECSYDQETHTLLISKPSDLNLKFKANSVEFNTEKASIKNAAGDEVIKLISDGLKIIARSQTVTMMGPQPLQPAASDLPALTEKMDSFGG